MKIIFNRQKLINDISPLLCAVTSHALNQATDGILILAEEPDDIMLITYDLEKGVREKVEGEVLEGGSYVINAQKFYSTLKVLDGESVTLTVERDLKVKIESGNSLYTMSARPAADFPEMQKQNTENGIIIKTGDLRAMMVKTMYAMGINDQRPVLNGIYFYATENNLLAVACDSFKLAKCISHIDIKNNSTKEPLRYRMLLPQRTVGELVKMLPDDDETTVLIKISRAQAQFFFGSFVLFTRLVEGEYIDYDRIILKNHKIKVRVDRRALLGALERAAIITEERIIGSGRTHVKLNFQGNVLNVNATSSLGSCNEDIPIEHEGDDVLIGFNNRYLIDSVKACSTDVIEISMTTALTSVNITPVDPDESIEELFFLLPIRMKDL